MFKIFNRNKWHLSKKDISNYNEVRDERNELLCYAPFHSMTFLPTGDIYTCFHYNLRRSIGKYPENSIEEVWNGPILNKIRTSIKKHNLNNGCEECYNQIKLGNYYSAMSWHYDCLGKHKHSEYPTSLDFQLSNICNYECIMCSGELSNSIRQKREHADIYTNPYDDKFVEQLMPYIPHLQQAVFTGGEPFLNPLYYKIWDAMIEKNPQCIVAVTTNGSILTDKIKEYLSKLRFNFSISINAVDKEIYEKIHQGGNLQNVLGNYLYYKEYCNSEGTQIIIKICPLRQNIYHIPKLVEYFNSHNTAISFNKVMYPPHCSLWNLSSDSLCRIIEFLKENTFVPKTKIQEQNLSRYNILINQISHWCEDAKRREASNIPSMGNAELKRILYEKARKYLESVDLSKEESKKELQAFIEKMDKIEEMIDNEAIIRNYLLYIIEMPMSFIVPNIKSRTAEMLKSRIIYSYENSV